MRDKEFDPDDVLKEALEVFWEQGFETTNMPKLPDSRGGRVHFYNAFGSERDVCLRILDLYFEAVRGHLEMFVAFHAALKKLQIAPERIAGSHGGFVQSSEMEAITATK
jgi:hypothetical protein